MKNDFEEQLKKELQSQSVLEEEARELMEALNKISKLSKTERSYAFKRSFLDSLSEKEKTDRKTFLFLPRVYVTALAFVLLLFIFIAGIVNAQKSLPGQPLYPIKVLSENIVKAVNPSFKDEIIKRRSEEIKNLTEQKKDSDLLKKTINDYNDELKDTRTINKVKIEESQKNLEEAKEKSEKENKKEIEKAIIQTEIKKEDQEKKEKPDSKVEFKENKDSDGEAGEVRKAQDKN